MSRPSQTDDAATQPAQTVSTANPNKGTAWDPIVTASKAFLLVIYSVIAALGAIMIWHLVDIRSERHVLAVNPWLQWAVAGIFVCLAVPLSFHDIHMHIQHYVAPGLQKYYIRIIWMVPIYSIQSWLALRYHQQGIYLETAREAYEAWVIYSFFKLMVMFLGPNWEKAQEELDTLPDKEAKLMFPFCCCKPWSMTKTFLVRSSFGIFQYVFIRVLFAVVTFICYFNGVGGDEEHWLDPATLYPYRMIAINLSQSWALYCLFLFYHELKDKLKPLNPFNKFVAVKCVVFLSFWQYIIISIIAYYEMLPETLEYTAEEVAIALQNFMICIEMALAAVLHFKCFSYRDFEEGGPLDKFRSKKQTAATAFAEMLPFEAVFDAKQAAHALTGGVKKAVGLKKGQKQVMSPAPVAQDNGDVQEPHTSGNMPSARQQSLPWHTHADAGSSVPSQGLRMASVESNGSRILIGPGGFNIVQTSSERDASQRGSLTLVPGPTVTYSARTSNIAQGAYLDPTTASVLQQYGVTPASMHMYPHQSWPPTNTTGPATFNGAATSPSLVLPQLPQQHVMYQLPYMPSSAHLGVGSFGSTGHRQVSSAGVVSGNSASAGTSSVV